MQLSSDTAIAMQQNLTTIAILQWHCVTHNTQTMQQHEHTIHMCTHTRTCNQHQPLTYMHTDDDDDDDDADDDDDDDDDDE